jgi:hypothetical protein
VSGQGTLVPSIASTLSKRIYGINTLSPFEPSAARETLFNFCAYTQEEP